MLEGRLSATQNLKLDLFLLRKKSLVRNYSKFVLKNVNKLPYDFLFSSQFRAKYLHYEGTILIASSIKKEIAKEFVLV